MTLATPGAESRLSTGKFSPDSTHDFALLKGWIDRVFITGWAFALDDERVLPKLGHLTAHLLPVSGFSEASFARHGYEESFSTQIEHGVFDYCGMPRGAKAFIRESEDADAAKAGLEAAVAQVVAAITSPRTS